MALPPLLRSTPETAQRRWIDAAVDIAVKLLPLPLTECLHRDARIQRRGSHAHGGARRFHMRRSGLEVGIPCDGILNERGEIGVAEGENPIWHDRAAAMRSGPLIGDLIARRLGCDVGAGGRIFESTTRRHETADDGNKRGRSERCSCVSSLVVTAFEDARAEVLEHEPIELRHRRGQSRDGGFGSRRDDLV